MTRNENVTPPRAWKIGAWLTVEQSLKIESSIFPLKVCESTECTASPIHSAALCTVITTDCAAEVGIVTLNLARHEVQV